MGTRQPFVGNNFVTSYGKCGSTKEHDWPCDGDMLKPKAFKIVLQAALDYENDGRNRRSEYA